MAEPDDGLPDPEVRGKKRVAAAYGAIAMFEVL
jgi:hypothetical protein